MKADGIRKLYYSIGEVSALTGLEPHVLRYWETEFEQLKPRKNRSGNRVYTERDLALVVRIRRLLRDDKYTLEGARQVLAREEAGEDGARNNADRLLLELRGFLEDLLRKLP